MRKSILFLSIAAALASGPAFAVDQTLQQAESLDNNGQYTTPTGSTASVQPNPQAIQQAEAQDAQANNEALSAANSYIGSKEQSQTSQDMSSVSGTTLSAGNILPPVAQNWYSQYQSNTAQANYWTGQIWQTYSYSCGTTKSPETCWSSYYDATAAANASYYSGLASTDYQHYQEDVQQHAEINGQSATQSTMSATAATQSTQDYNQAVSQNNQANADLNASGASTTSAYAGVNAANEQSGTQASNTATAEINAETNGALSGSMAFSGAAPANAFAGQQDNIDVQAIQQNAPAQEMSNLEAADQSAENDQAQEYVAQQQAQTAEQTDQQQAQAMQEKADTAPTIHSQEAWQSAANAAQAKASSERQAAQAALNQQNADQAQEQQDTNQASNLANSAATSADSQVEAQGQAWDSQELRKIQQMTGVVQGAAQ